MRSSIPYYILMLLEMEGQVGIPGIGRLTQSRHAAHLKVAHTRIDPPHASGLLEISADSKGKLLERYISYQSGSRRKDVRLAIARFGQQIIREIERTGFAHFQAFGTFSRINGQIVFEPSQEAFNARYHGLQPVQILLDPADVSQPVTYPVEAAVQAPVMPVTSPEPEPVIEQVTEAAEAPARRRAIPVFLVALIVLVLATCIFAFIQYKVKQQALAEQALFNRSPVSERSELPAPDDPQLTTPDSGALDTTPSTSREIPDVEPQQDLETATSDDNENETGSETGSVTPAESSNSSVMPCLIVIGAFGEQANVTRMSQRVEAMGRTVVTMPRGELTIVGVPVACSGNAMQAELATLRNELEAQAWLLKR